MSNFLFHTFISKAIFFSILGDASVSLPEMVHTVFYCVHCSPNDPSKSFNGTIEQVYQHFGAVHQDGSNSFQFYVVALLKCFYCEEIGTYHSLVKHHIEKHSSQQFTVIDRINPNKCGMCCFKDGDLMEHFSIKHDLHSTRNFSNPIAYSEEWINELLTINLCHNIHFDQKQPGYLICGFCGQKVDCDQYLSHFNEHTYEFKCSHCLYRSADFVEFILHEKNAHNVDSLDYHISLFLKTIKNKSLNTKLVFRNGLIMNNFNVVQTKFDVCKHFDEFINIFMKKKREEVKKRSELSSVHNTLNLTQNIEAQRKLAKSLFVSNIPEMSENTDIYDLFFKLCKKLDLNVSTDDIKDIRPYESGIVVTFHQIEIKELILNNSIGKFVWSDEVLPIQEGIQERTPFKVFCTIRPHLTPYYRELWLEVLKCQLKHKDLYSYRISDNGIAIKRNSTSIEQIINTKEQLQEYVKKNEV